MRRIILLLLLLGLSSLFAESFKFLNRVGTIKLEYAKQVRPYDDELIVNSGDSIFYYDVFSKAFPILKGIYRSDKSIDDLLLIKKDEFLIASESVAVEISKADSLNKAYPEARIKSVLGSTLSREGSMVYIGNSDTGLYIEDIRRGSISQYHDSYGLIDVYTQWPYIYALNRYGLVIIDINDVYFPKQIADNYNILKPGCLSVSGSKCVVGTDKEIIFLSVSNSGQPKIVSRQRVAYPVEAVQIVNEEVYVVLGRGGLKIYDLSNLKNPREIDSYDTPGQALDVFVDTNYIYVADGDKGVVILKYE
jgi:hypothetical protein